MSNLPYDAAKVKKIPITAYLESQNIAVRGNRCAAMWRGGDNLSVSIDVAKNCWYDHKANEGGSVIDLAMKLEGLGFAAAVRALGERFAITPDADGVTRRRMPKSPQQPDKIKICQAVKIGMTEDDLCALSPTEQRLARQLRDALGDNDANDLNALSEAYDKAITKDTPTTTPAAGTATAANGGLDFGSMLIRGVDLHAMPAPKQRWIVDQLIEHGDKGQIVAPPKTRKTYTAMNLALDISSGRPFMGFEVSERVPVLYIDLELKRDNLIRREHAITADLGISEVDGVDWLSMRGKGQQVRENEDALISLINANGYGVVVLDCTYKLYLDGENENDAVAMNRYLDWKSRICEATSAAVIDILHDAKGFSGDRQGNDRGSGSNVHARDYDFRMVLTPDAVTENGVVFDFYGREIANSTDRLGIYEGDNCAALVYHPELTAQKLTSATANAIGKAEANAANMIAVVSRDGEKVLDEIKINGVKPKGELQTKMHVKGISRDRFKAALASLLGDGAIICDRFKGHERRSYDMIGTPNQIESLRREVEANKCHLKYLAGYSQGELDGV